MSIVAAILAIILVFVVTREICLFKEGVIWVRDGAMDVYPFFYLYRDGSFFNFLSGLETSVSPPTPLYVGLFKIEIGERGILFILTPWIGLSLGIALIAGWPPIRTLLSRTLDDWYTTEVSDTGKGGSDA